jgi:phosphate/sulfate permease
MDTIQQFREYLSERIWEIKNRSFSWGLIVTSVVGVAAFLYLTLVPEKDNLIIHWWLKLSNQLWIIFPVIIAPFLGAVLYLVIFWVKTKKLMREMYSWKLTQHVGTVKSLTVTKINQKKRNEKFFRK